MRTQHAIRGDKWLQWERVGVIPYVRMRFRFVVPIRMRQTESVYVVIQNVSAHESDRKFQELRHYRFVFQTIKNGGRY